MPCDLDASTADLNRIEHSKSLEEGSGRIDIANAQEFHTSLAYSKYVEDKGRQSFTYTQCFTRTSPQEEHADKAAVTERGI